MAFLLLGELMHYRWRLDVKLCASENWRVFSSRPKGRFPGSAKLTWAVVICFNEQRYLLRPLLKAPYLKALFNSYEVLLGETLVVRSLQTSRITGAVLNLLEILSNAGRLQLLYGNCVSAKG